MMHSYYLLLFCHPEESRDLFPMKRSFTSFRMTFFFPCIAGLKHDSNDAFLLLVAFLSSRGIEGSVSNEEILHFVQDDIFFSLYRRAKARLR